MAIEMKAVGLDIAKNVFQVHGVDHRGKTVLRNGFVDLNSQRVFLQQILCLIGVEAAPGAYYWARVLRILGHEGSVGGSTVRRAPSEVTEKRSQRCPRRFCAAVSRPSMR